MFGCQFLFFAVVNCACTSFFFGGVCIVANREEMKGNHISHQESIDVSFVLEFLRCLLGSIGHTTERKRDPTEALIWVYQFL